MPIRFRCAYCNQLMGIARRKAGSVVRCPKCAGQVVVPVPENGEEHEPEHPQPLAANPRDGGVFEQSDFGKVFDEGFGPAQQVLQPPNLPAPPAGNPRMAAGPASPSPAFAEYEAVPLGPLKGAPRGIFLTSGVLAVVSALVVVLMGMAFFLGLLLGRSSQP